MKVTKAELMQIIREEVEAYKKVKLLENRRAQILRQLNEMDETVTETKVCSECGRPMEEENMEEIFGMFKADPKKEAAKVDMMKELIKKHPTYSSNVGAIADKYGKNDDEILTKMAQFFAKEGGIADGKLVGIKSFVYDPKSGNFVDRTKVSQPYGPAGMEP